MSKKKRQKLEPAIIVALIGLAGTIVAALLASPIIANVFSKTPTPAPTGPITGNSRLVFENDFESGTISGFAFESGQGQITKDKGNPVLELRAEDNNNTTAIFGSNDFSDGAIEFQINFEIFSGFILSFRGSNGQTYTLYLSPNAGEIKLGFGSAANDWDLETFDSNSTRLFAFNEDTWYLVRLEVTGDQMTVWVDGNRVLSGKDSRLQQGSMEFSIQPPGTVLLDNVKVWETVR
jgi:hypothetical protein